MATQTKGQPRPTLEAAKGMLANLGWTPSGGSWESDYTVFAFSQESYPGTYGGAAAVVSWSAEYGWLSLPDAKRAGVRFV